MHKIKAIISLILLLSLVFTSQSFAHPFGEMSVEDEHKLGEKYNLAMKTQAPIIYDPLVVDYLEEILQNLLIYVDTKGYEYEANMLLDSSLNAFAAPAGYIFFNSGLFLKLENESELASILAHEIAHVSQRHIAKRYGKSNAISVATILASLASVLASSSDVTGAVFAGSLAAGQSALLNFSRNDENEADRVGFEYTVKAGYDPFGYVSSFQKLQDQIGHDSSYPVYLSTHPDLDDRITQMASRIRSQGENYSPRRLDNSEFLFVQTFVRANYQEIKTARAIIEKKDMSKPENKLALATLAMREMNLNQAEKLFSELLKDVNSRDFSTKYNSARKAFFLREIGNYHYKYGELNLATELFLYSLALQDSDLMTQFYLARAYDKASNFSEAEKFYSSILATYPHDAQVHNLLGQVYGKDDKHMLGYLHLAYGSLYNGNFRQAENMQKKAKELAKSHDEKEKLKKFSKDYKEYKDLFKV